MFFCCVLVHSFCLEAVFQTEASTKPRLLLQKQVLLQIGLLFICFPYMFYHFFIVKDIALLVLLGRGIKPTESLVSTAPCFGGKAHRIRGDKDKPRER